RTAARRRGCRPRSAARGSRAGGLAVAEVPSSLELAVEPAAEATVPPQGFSARKSVLLATAGTAVLNVSTTVVNFVLALVLTSLRQAAMKGFNRVVLGRVPETLIVPGLSLLLVGAVWWIRGRHLTSEWAVGLTVAAVLVAFLVGTLMLRLVVPDQVRRAQP